MPTPRLLARALAALTLALATVVALSIPASADPSRWRGPAPTQAGITAERGSFAVSSTSVSGFSTPGFGSATIYYPTTTTAGTFGGRKPRANETSVRRDQRS